MEKRQYINLTKVHEITKISYNKLHRAFRYSDFDVFTPKEKKAIYKACDDLFFEHRLEIQALDKVLND